MFRTCWHKEWLENMIITVYKNMSLQDYVTDFPRGERSPEAEEQDNYCTAKSHLSASASSLTSMQNLLLATALTFLSFTF